MKPIRRDVESVRPSRRPEYKKNAFEIGEVAQRLDHRTGSFTSGPKSYSPAESSVKRIRNRCPPAHAIFETLIIVEPCNAFEWHFRSAFRSGTNTLTVMPALCRGT